MFQAGLLVGLVCREQTVGVPAMVGGGATIRLPFGPSRTTTEAADDIRNALIHREKEAKIII